ncbi:class I SAM-dependent methyltransferase [Qipengyuania aquimaris]|uniref:Methyltransferase n=1 Tax=Qipengyuania aquimaris TaxID=255984 RepID=A0A9Q3XEA5_9SPHN|nr:hypothetical protein [Qipengyuania aquimaris]MBY6218680.1 hypothetical protein [Qipengyuania aquimaris]
MRLFLTAAVAAMVATPLAADNHAPDLDDVLAHERRADDRARDQYRHPAETLEFFRVEPGMTVAEFAPGGGWYTRVLAPYLLPAGKYVAINRDSDDGGFSNRAAQARALSWTEDFKSAFAEAYGVDAAGVHAYEIDEVPDEVKGTVDRVMIVRAMHGPWNGEVLREYLVDMRALLKDDGMVGIVQHRAPADASWSDVNPAGGYMRQADVIKIMELSGYELVESSEINANPKDPANWEGGVWTLPPVLRYGDQDRDRYLAIGESDRMTLLFKKAH